MTFPGKAFLGVLFFSLACASVCFALLQALGVWRGIVTFEVAVASGYLIAWLRHKAD